MVLRNACRPRVRPVAKLRARPAQWPADAKSQATGGASEQAQSASDIGLQVVDRLSPTAMRSKPSSITRLRRASAEIRPWVVDAGWVIVVLVSPRLAVIDITLQLSTTCQAAAARRQ